MTRSDLAIALAGLEPATTGVDPAAQLAWAATIGFSAVRLNLLARGTRARDLDRSARRGLGATLRRLELGFHGLDLWIPPEHFLEPERLDRAVGAVTAAIELAEELASLAGTEGARPPVGCTLPPDLAEDVTRTLGQVAERHHIPIADHACPAREHPTESLAIGIDPATVLLVGKETPAKAVARAGHHAACIRLSDAAQHGRVEPGVAGGRLDLETFAASVSVGGSHRPVVLDLRGIADQAAAAQRIIDRWPGVM
jgi:hypothetical protein